MSKIVLQPNASGTGTLTITAPNTNTDRTLNIPDVAGNLVTTGDTASITAGMLGSTLDLSSKTLTLPSGSTKSKYFYAWLGSVQGPQGTGSITAGVATTCALDNVIQSDSSFNTSTYTWTATAADAGTWHFFGQVGMYINGNNGGDMWAVLYHNGSLADGGYNWVSASQTNTWRHVLSHTKGIINISSGDTIQLRGRMAFGTQINFFAGDTAGGYKQTALLGVKIA